MKETEKNHLILFSEIKINGVELNNRIALAPMTSISA